MRNFPPSFSYFLIFPELTEAAKQERLQQLRESIIQLVSLVEKEGGGGERGGEGEKPNGLGRNSLLMFESIAILASCRRVIISSRN